jgi:hypothetical protein
VSVDIELFAWITEFPTTEEDPLPLFTDKSNEKALSERMKEKFNTHKVVCGLDIESINEDCVRFVKQVMSYKLLRKCQRDQVSTCAIEMVEKCIEGVQMNWEMFFVN